MAYTENATCGIRKEGDHWRHFHDGGDHPGLFADSDTARWGCNVTPDDAVEINKTRLINKDDIGESIRQRLASAIEAPSGVETGHTDSTEGESAVGATSAETPTLSSPRRG